MKVDGRTEKRTDGWTVDPRDIIREQQITVIQALYVPFEAFGAKNYA